MMSQTYLFSTLLCLGVLVEQNVVARGPRIQMKWCAVGSEEKSKCDRWSQQSKRRVTCASAPTTEDCIALILKRGADAMNLDGGHIYTAGKCGLVPVLAENRKPSDGFDYNTACYYRPLEGYLAVAVVRKSDAHLTWNSLTGKKSCHTAVGRTAGWNIPVGLLINQTGSCNVDKFFSQSCAPGSDPNSNLCALCVGDERGEHKCAANSSERYYGYTGALRCLAERAGDVAFLKDSTILENTDGKNTEEWARNLKREDFELLCLDGTRKPVTEARNCHLARAPNHAVVSREDNKRLVKMVLYQQQSQFGRFAPRCLSGDFCMFQSATKNLLFNDNTECLSIPYAKETYDKYLGQEYVTAITNVKRCSSSSPLGACTLLSN